MRHRDDVELAIQRNWRLAQQAEAPLLQVTVLFTSAEVIPGAIRRAAALATRLSAHITVLVPQVVPFPLPLESPPVLVDFNERRFRALAEEAGVTSNLQIYLCRDRYDAIRSAL